MSYLSSDLITSVKKRANVPTSQSTFQTADFLRFADEEIRSKILPLVLKNLEDYYIWKSDTLVVPTQSSYLIPTRAVGAKLRDVELVLVADDQTRVPLERLNREDLLASYTGAGTGCFIRRKQGFYFDGNKVVIYPNPIGIGQAWYLRQTYYSRPSQLVDVTACALVSSINAGLNQITVASLPSTISTSTTVDFVKANPHFECSAIDQSITNISGTTLTFSATLPTDLSVGDYVCLSGQSCVIQVPVEIQPLLYQYVVVRCLSSQGDKEQLADEVSEIKKMEENALILLSPRVDGKAKRASNSRGMNRFV